MALTTTPMLTTTQSSGSASVTGVNKRCASTEYSGDERIVLQQAMAQLIVPIDDGFLTE